MMDMFTNSYNIAQDNDTWEDVPEDQGLVHALRDIVGSQ